MIFTEFVTTSFQLWIYADLTSKIICIFRHIVIFLSPPFHPCTQRLKTTLYLDKCQSALSNFIKSYFIPSTCHEVMMLLSLKPKQICDRLMYNCRIIWYKHWYFLFYVSGNMGKFSKTSFLSQTITFLIWGINTVGFVQLRFGHIVLSYWCNIVT